MQRIFLLGGHDLEMATIRQLLDDNGENYIDHNLSWSNADVNAYYDDMLARQHSTLFYGIELRGNAPGGVGYVLIDHHNENSGKVSSIEQVAEVLGLKLSRYQQLVAANDAGYIGAMLAIGATRQEVEDIRLRDRQMQGVTAAEEEVAEKELADVQVCNGIKVVKTSLCHFSPLVDRLYPYGQLLVYSNSELTYYGSDSRTLVENYGRLVEEGIAYYGGTNCSFFGIGAGHCSPHQIGQYVDQIIGLVGVSK